MKVDTQQLGTASYWAFRLSILVLPLLGASVASLLRLHGTSLVLCKTAMKVCPGRGGAMAAVMLLAVLAPLVRAQQLPSQPPVTIVRSGGALSTNVVIMIVVCTVGGVIILGALGGLIFVFFEEEGSEGGQRGPPNL